MFSSVSKFIKAVVLTFVIAAICLLISLTIIIFVLNEKQQNRLVMTLVSTVSNSEVKSKQLNLSYQEGKIQIKAQHLTWERPDKHIRLDTERLTITCSLTPAIKPPLTVRSIILQNPTFDLSSYPSNKLTKSHKHNDGITAYFLRKCTIIIKDGKVLLPNDIQLLNISINITEGKEGNSHQVNFKAKGKWRDAVFPISAEGIAKLFTPKSELDLQLLVNSFPLQLIKIDDRLRFDHGTATVKSRLSSVDGLKHFNLENDIEFSDIKFLFGNSGNNKHYQFSSLTLEIRAEYDHGRFSIQPAILKNKSFLLELTGNLDVNPDSPLLDFRLSSHEMTIPVLKKLLPDPLLGHWLTTELFPKFTNGKVVLNNLQIKGTLEEIAHLNRPENQNALNLSLALTDTAITLERPDGVFSGSSGHLQIKNGKLLVSDISGKMRETTITQASYQIDNLFEKQITSRFSVDCLTTLSDLARLSSISYMPDQLKKDGQFLSGFSGHIQASVKAHYNPSFDALRFDQFEATIKDVTSAEFFQGSPIMLKELTIQNDAHSKNILTGHGKWKQSDFNLSGFFRDDSTGNIIIDTRFDLPTLLPFIEKTEILPGSSKTKTYPAKFSVQKHDEGFLFNGHITLPELPMPSCTEDDNHLTTGDFSVKFTTSDWEDINIGDLTISYGDLFLKGSGKGDLGKLKAKLDIHSPEWSNCSSSAGTEKENRSKNHLKADLQLALDLDKPKESQIFGKLQGSGLNLPLPGIASPAENVHFDLLFSGKRVELKKFDFFLKHSQPNEPINISGYLEKNEQLTGSLLVNAKSILWSDIFSLSSGSDETEQEKDTTQNNILTNEQGIVIKSKIKQLDLEGLFISPIYLQGHLVDGRFYPTQIAARTKNGRLGMLATTGDDQEDKLQFSFFIKDQKINQLDRFFPYSENRDIKGQLTLGGSLYSRGNTIEKLRSKLHGSIALDLQEATLKGNYILVRLLELLSIENLFSKKADYAEDGDLYIKSIKGNMSLDDSILTCNDIFIDTIAFDASGDLRVDLNQNFIESHLAVSPFGTVDTIISTIPIIGHILTGKNKSLVSYHFMIRGQLPEPEISYIPLEDIPSSLLGYGERLLSPSTYLFFLNESEKEQDYDRESEQLVKQIEESFTSETIVEN